jgi:hypothetical protein
MSDYLDLAELTEGDELPEADVPLRKGKVRVRALTRAEVMIVRSSVKSIEDAIKRTAELERKMLAKAMVSPAMNVAQVERWQETSAAGEIEPVVQVVQGLSGLLEGAAKEAYKAFEADPDAEFRLPAG